MVFMSQVEVCLGCALRPLVTVEGELTVTFSCFRALQMMSATSEEDMSVPVFHAHTAFLHKSVHHTYTDTAGNRNVGEVCQPKLIGEHLVKAAIQ